MDRGVVIIDLVCNDLRYSFYTRSTRLHSQQTLNPQLNYDREVICLKNSAENSDEKTHISFGQLLLSTLSAFIGVQSNANRERDFKYGKVSHFIAIGLLFGLVFIGTLVGIVKLVLNLSGS